MQSHELMNIQCAYDRVENIYMVQIGNQVSTFTDYLDAKHFIDQKVMRIWWRYEEMIGSSANQR